MGFWKILVTILLGVVALMLVLVVDLTICYGLMRLTGLQVDTTAYNIVLVVFMFIVSAVLMSFIYWFAIKIDGRN